jgi:DNA-binding phage protein
MAEITFKANDSGHRIQLDDQDRAAIAEALKAKQASGITASEIAKELGVGRTYLYALADNNFIELTRFARLQAYLGIQLLTEAQVDSYLELLRQLLLKL